MKLVTFKNNEVKQEINKIKDNFFNFMSTFAVILASADNPEINLENLKDFMLNFAQDENDIDSIVNIENKQEAIQALLFLFMREFKLLLDEFLVTSIKYKDFLEYIDENNGLSTLLSNEFLEQHIFKEGLNQKDLEENFDKYYKVLKSMGMNIEA